MKDILKIALSQFGVTEIKGEIDNPEVMKYYHETDRKWVNHDETPWCDAFMDWCAMKSGLKFSPGLIARGWMEMGREVLPEHVELLALEIPIIVVLWRESIKGPWGHVGLFVKKYGTTIWLLGGNQGIGQVNISPYPEHRVLGYRRLWV